MSDEVVRVQVAGAHEVVSAGLRSLLTSIGRIRFVDACEAAPDVVLYDAIGIQYDGGAELDGLIKDGDAAVVVVGRDLRPDLAAQALVRGADGCVSLEADGPTIWATIEAAAARDLDGAFADDDHLGAGPPRLGEEAGLTPREVEVLALITLGYTNQAIADHCFLTINTVKSFVRTAYRKIGATNRAQAVIWCIQHGFEPPG